jgi:hypothetical protein
MSQRGWHGLSGRTNAFEALHSQDNPSPQKPCLTGLQSRTYVNGSKRERTRGRHSLSRFPARVDVRRESGRRDSNPRHPAWEAARGSSQVKPAKDLRQRLPRLTRPLVPTKPKMQTPKPPTGIWAGRRPRPATFRPRLSTVNPQLTRRRPIRWPSWPPRLPPSRRPSERGDGLRSMRSRPWTFVFADSPPTSKRAVPADVSDGKAFLLHRAKGKPRAISSPRQPTPVGC